MAVPNWTSAALGAHETSGLSADAPLVAAQAIPASPTVERWSDSGTVAGSDITESGYPGRRVHDSTIDYETKPNVDRTTHYFVWDFGSAGIPPFDGLAIGDSNLGSIGCTSLVLELCNQSPNPNGGFGIIATLCTITSPGNTRFLQLDLHHTGSVPLRYTDVRYARLKVICGSAARPQLREVFLTRRCQLARQPLVGFDPRALADSEEMGTTKGNAIDKVVFATNQFKLDASWILSGAQAYADVLAFFKRAKGAFLWCQNPSTLPAKWHLLMGIGKHVQPSLGNALYEYRLLADEVGPEAYHLANLE
jgi:hypothetical protein